ncbi:MAG: hypothetical protein ABUL60_19570 [Myxococcales bacterium]
MKQRRDRGRASMRVGFFSLAWLALGAAAACGNDDTSGGPKIVIAGSATQPHFGGSAGTGSTIPSGAGDAGAPGSGPEAGSGVGGAPGGSGAVGSTSVGGDPGDLEAGSSSGGSAGTADGGTAGAAGADGTPPLLPGTGVGTLGRSCAGPSDCAVGLTCITPKHLVLAGAAPPHGVCSAPCTSNDDCTQRSPDALCMAFGSDGSAASYCVEGCSFGPTGAAAKCHGRRDFACNPALLEPTADSCNGIEDCAQGDLCIDGFCNAVSPGCLPSCRGDLDCAPGLYCDQSFLTGTCTPKKPTGKRLGEPCTVPLAQEPEEPDECIGFCQADGVSGRAGHCAATCGLARECAWDPASGKFDGVCFYSSILTTDGEVGDFGFCTPACSCSNGCKDPTLACSLLSGSSLDTQNFNGPGLCFASDPSSPDMCGVGGASGSGAGGFGGAQ